MALEFFAMAMAVNFFGDDDGARFSNGYHTFFFGNGVCTTDPWRVTD